MTEDTLKLILKCTEWDKLSSIPGCERRQSFGTYNNVLVSRDPLTIEGYTGLWIYKTPRSDKDDIAAQAAMNHNVRAIRKWNELNPGFPAYKIDKSWITPYLGNTPASDEQIAEKLIEIYLRTRNIIVDACGSMNFLVHENEVICVDVDQAIRTGSIASDTYLHDIGLNDHLPYWEDFTVNYGRPKTVNVIRTLVYLEKNLEDHEIKDDYIIPDVIAKLHIFRRVEPVLTPEIMDILLMITILDPAHELGDGYVTPQFVKRLLALPAQQPLTKELLFSELRINQQTFMSSFPTSFSQLLKDRGWNGIKQLLGCILRVNWALCEQKDRDGLTLLHLAAAWGHESLAKYLCIMGANLTTKTSTTPDNKELCANFPRGWTAMDLALGHERDLIVILLFKHRVRYVPVISGQKHVIHVMAKEGLLCHIEALLKQNSGLVNIGDGYNRTPLSWAAANGWYQVTNFLLNHGANPNIAMRVPASKAQTFNNYSPLDWAIQGGHRQVIEVLMQHGARANHRHDSPGVIRQHRVAIMGAFSAGHESTSNHAGLSIFKRPKPARSNNTVEENSTMDIAFSPWVLPSK